MNEFFTGFLYLAGGINNNNGILLCNPHTYSAGMAVQIIFGAIYGNLSQINCKICLKSTGLHKFFDWFCGVLFEGDSPLIKNTIGQHSPMICCKIGHSYEAFSFTYLFS